MKLLRKFLVGIFAILVTSLLAIVVVMASFNDPSIMIWAFLGVLSLVIGFMLT